MIVAWIAYTQARVSKFTVLGAGSAPSHLLRIGWPGGAYVICHLLLGLAQPLCWDPLGVRIRLQRCLLLGLVE